MSTAAPEGCEVNGTVCRRGYVAAAGADQQGSYISAATEAARLEGEIAALQEQLGRVRWSAGLQ